jgi:prepilin-type N-terminal cleavage/methylation domain-containing protein
MAARTGALNAFSLIELLVVVGIISILMMIGVPNYKVAQMRAKVGRAKADIAVLSGAFEAFAVDHNAYPGSVINNQGRFTCSGSWGYTVGLRGLTTPIAYLGSLRYPDPFLIRRMQEETDELARLEGAVLGYSFANSHQMNVTGPRYIVYSMGPSQKPVRYLNTPVTMNSMHILLGLESRRYLDRFQYDPSNGTVSRGYVFRYQQ